MILGSITKVARIVGRTARYRAQVIQFFDDTKIFPGQLLEALEVDAGVRLAVYAAFTHHAPAAKALLKGLLEKMDKSEREKLPEDVLYDIRELDMDAEVGAASTCGAGESVAVVGVESAPSLYDIVIESDSRSLTSPAHLKRLFDFFGGFNEAHAAEFVTALSSQNCCFRAYFAKLEETQKDRILTLFRDSFEERNVDFAKIGPALDIVGAAPLDNEGCKNKVLTAIRMEPIGEFYSKAKAMEYLNAGYVTIFSGGTGNPYFTTDTASSLRAIEIEADAMFKGTRVDGIYTADPEKDPNAVKFDKITYDEIYNRGLKVMDLTATTMCKENHLPIIVFNMDKPGNLKKVIDGENIGTTVY